jgi:hypothetical protein
MKNNMYLTLAILSSTMQLFAAEQPEITPHVLAEASELQPADIKTIKTLIDTSYADTDSGLLVNDDAISASWQRSTHELARLTSGVGAWSIHDAMVAKNASFVGSRSLLYTAIDTNSSNSVIDLAVGIFLAQYLMDQNTQLQLLPLKPAIVSVLTTTFAHGGLREKFALPKLKMLLAKRDISADALLRETILETRTSTLSLHEHPAVFSPEITKALLDAGVFAPDINDRQTAILVNLMTKFPGDTEEERRIEKEKFMDSMGWTTAEPTQPTETLPAPSESPAPAGTSGAGAVEEAERARQAAEEAQRVRQQEEAAAEQARLAQQQEAARLAAAEEARVAKEQAAPSAQKDAQMALVNKLIVDIVSPLPEQPEEKRPTLRSSVPATDAAAKKAIEAAVNSGALTDVNTPRSAHGINLLHWAAERGYPEVARYLIEQKANPALKSPSGMTALEIALQNKHTAVAALLAPVSPQPAQRFIPKEKPTAPRAEEVTAPQEEFTEELKKRAGRQLTQQNIRQIWAEIKPGGTPLTAGEVEQLVAFASADWRTSKDQTVSHLGRVSTQLIRSRKDAINDVSDVSDDIKAQWHAIAQGK